MSSEGHIRDFYEYTLAKGFQRELFLSRDNMEKYIDTVVEAFNGYPLFQYIFRKKYDADLMTRITNLDLRTRFHTLAGIASSAKFESILIIEPPLAKKPGMLDYIKHADARDAAVFIKPSTYRQDSFENYAVKKMRPYMDEKTWYIYIFTTKKEYQRKGYGKKLMNLMCSYADERKCRISLETNLEDNVAMYEQFGFRLMDSSIYRKKVMHYVFLYEAGRA